VCVCVCVCVLCCVVCVYVCVCVGVGVRHWVRSGVTKTHYAYNGVVEKVSLKKKKDVRYSAIRNHLYRLNL